VFLCQGLPLSGRAAVGVKEQMGSWADLWQLARVGWTLFKLPGPSFSLATAAAAAASEERKVSQPNSCFCHE